MAYDKITDAPRTVKEAIDWLIRIGDMDKSQSNGSATVANCTALYKAIKALTGSGRSLEGDIKGLIKGLAGFIGYQGGTISGGGIIKNNGSSYTSAYQTSAATWPTCKSGGQCSCCQGSKCNCSTTSKAGATSCDGQCCNTCDVRICAGIFVALVPALHTALDGLKRRCNENKTAMITSDGLKGYFTALGYEDKDLNGQLQARLVNTKLSSAIRQLEGLKKNISSAFNSNRQNQNGFTATTNAVAPSNGSSSPRTVREMLLWLMGLPYCQNYKEFTEKLKNKTTDVLGSTGRTNNEYHLHKQLSAVIFHLPTVFYAVEGGISYLNEVFEQFKKDAPKPRFCYPSDGDQFLKTLSAYVAVCYPILKYLMQRCDRDPRSRPRRGTGASATPVAEEQDGAWGYLLVSGQENKDAQQPKAAATAAPSSAPKTALKDYLVFMGFQTPNGTVTGDQLYDNALKECFSDTMKTDDEDEDDKAGTTGTVRTGRSGATSKDQKLPALRKLAKHVLQQAYGQGAGVGVSSPNGTTPTTIRQMMLWLIGLPLTEAYKSSDAKSLFGNNSRVLQEINQNEALKELEQPSAGRRLKTSTAAATGKHFKQQLKDSIVGMIMLFQRIEGGLGSVLEFLKEGFKDTSVGGAKEKFKYDQDKLLDVFSSYVYKVHVQLRFLKVMCKTEKANGGWENCWYTRTSSVSQGDSIQCKCVLGSAYMPCPGMLTHFLNSTNEKNKFQLCKDGKQEEQYQMGFKGTYSSSNIKGSDIYDFLKELIEEIPTTQASSQPPPTPKPLSLLTQYCVAIGNMDPVSLGDHFDVFRELANGMWDKIKGDIEKNSLRGITKDDTDGSTASNALHDALKAVWPSSHKEHNDGDLRSLTGCNDGNNCTPFIASLSHGLYKYFDPTKLSSPAQKIDWLYMKMSSLYGKLAALKTEMTEKCQCCPKGNPNPQANPACPGITQCPSCLPQLYKMGLVFGDPMTIGPKQCVKLHQMMDKVLKATSKLCVVFQSIEDGRFKPYLLFSAMVVKENSNGKLTGGEELKAYTHKLGEEMYETYLEAKKQTDTQAVETNKSTREDALKCNCGAHTYTPPTEVPGTATTVTLTLYFQGANITEVVIQVPHDGPAYNPLVRLYPRNLKSIVDWILRIGQTRLGQGTSVASTKDRGVKEMCKILMPVVKTCVEGMEEEHSKELVTNVMSLMGLENKGNKEVGEEVKKELEKTKKSIEDKLNGNGDGFSMTFQSILTFKPNKYIDKVIADFGQKVYDVNKGSVSKRSFNCIAKSVSQCMSTALKQIKELAQTNQNLEKTYGIQVPDVNNDIQAVANLTSIDQLKTLCEGFQKFHEAYKKVEGAFNDHLTTAQSGAGKTQWDQITKCVEAFKVLGGCAKELGELSSCDKAENMPTASKKLEKLYDKLYDVHTSLNVGDLNELSAKVTTCIQQLDEVLEGDGKKALEKALKGKDSSSTTFDQLLKSYLSTLIGKLQTNNKKDNTECDIHLRVRNDLLQLSECLKVMCEVCSTGMKDFAHTLKQCVWETREKMKDIDKAKTKLEKLKEKLTSIKDAQSQNGDMTNDMTKSIKYIRSLLRNTYIFNPPIIVSTLINSQATSKMTKYLKQLPDLIRDRYVLQKWTDSPEVFCGVQRFEGGIVKKTDTEEIKKKLQDLLKDTFHTTPANDITIHDFQVKSLIYNFCHKEGIEQIGAGLEAMESVKKALGNVNQNPPKPPAGLDWSQLKEESKKRELLPLLKKLSTNSYLRYFATHLRDSVGYHTLSNTLGALEKVKEKLEAKPPNGEPAEWKNIQDLLKKETMTDLHKKLDSLLDKLYKEYIFEYPPFDWTKSCKRLMDKQAEAEQKSRKARDTQAVSPSPSSASNTCEMCVPSMAHIFIGFVPQMYRLFKMLREMTTKDGREHTLEFKNYGRDASKTTMSSLAGILSREGWRLKLGSDMSSGDEAFDLDASKKGTDIYTKMDAIIGDKEPGALVAQKDDASATDSSLKPLDKLFKAVMQHFRTKREELRKKREEKLKQEFNKDPNNKGIPFQPPPPVLPSTVRQVLFWLHEMDTNKTFYDAMSQHIDKLCRRSSIDISHDTILHVLKLSITQCLEVLATIEDPGRQNADYYYELYTEEHYYAYPEANIPLFFYTFVEKLMGAFLELNFVCVQCEFGATEGGWRDCEIGKAHKGAYEVQGSVCCICHERKTVGTPLHRVNVSGSVVCPRPLYSFLFGENTLKAPAEKKAYMSKGTMPCGFKLKNKAITDAATPGDATSSYYSP